MQTGGIGINMVTRRGTNKFHGGGRYMLSHDKLQSGNVPDIIKSDPRLKGGDKANHIDQIGDFGFDLGGPIVKDKLWFYGSYGKQDIRLVNFTQTKDKTLLTGYNGKLNWQATSNTMVSAFYFQGRKEKFGRSPGTGLNETDAFLWNQVNLGTEGGLPLGLWKAEVNHTFSPNFFVSAKAAYYDTGFGFANAVSEDEAKDLYETYAVPASGAPLFQAATANLNPWTEAQVDTENPQRGPLLIISGEKDNTVPWAIANASFKRQERNEGVTEIVEMPDRGHALTVDSGWRKVADTALAFVKRFV